MMELILLDVDMDQIFSQLKQELLWFQKRNTVDMLEDMVIDYDRRNVSVAGKDVHLTQTEYNVLALLSQNTGKVMTYSLIIRSIWGHMDECSIKKLQVNMANIRKKLGCRPGDNRYVINELGVGYRIADE